MTMKKNRIGSALLLSACIFAAVKPIANAQHPRATMDSLDQNSRDLLAVAMRFGDQYWNEDAGLVAAPPRPQSNPANTDMSTRGRAATATAPVSRSRYTVRESIWYALGL